MSWTVNRLSTLQMNLSNRSFVRQTSVALEKAGKEVATGRHADVFASLGAKAASTLKLRAKEDETQAYLMSNSTLSNKLEAMLTSVESVRDRVQDVLENALANASRPSNGAAALQMQARAALESIIGMLNTSFNGDHLFAGTRSDLSPMMRWDQVNSATGLSPENVFDSIVGAGPVDAAETGSMISAIDLAFSSADTVNTAWNYEETFFIGTEEYDGFGQLSARVTARISVGQEIGYGVQANDESFRDIIKGLAMLTTIDVSEISDEDAYEVWMGKVVDSLSSGQQGALDAASRIGFSQQVVELATQRLTDLSLVQRAQISEIESVDPYEAVTRMTNLEVQLQASYEVSARLSRLTILSSI